MAMKFIDDIRRDNLDSLRKRYGTTVAFAEILGRSESQVTQWIVGSAHSATGKKRGMRSSTARWIEEKCRLDSGWLDIDHSKNQEQPLDEVELLTRYQNCNKFRACVRLLMVDEAKLLPLDTSIRMAMAILKDHAREASLALGYSCKPNDPCSSHKQAEERFVSHMAKFMGDEESEWPCPQVRA